jgi:hypothetical protein
MLNFWSKLFNGKNDKICASLYRTMHNLHEKGSLHCQGIEKVKSTLNNIGCSKFWITHIVTNVKNFKYVINSRLRDQFLQIWNSDVFNSAKYLNYRIYNTQFK